MKSSSQGLRSWCRRWHRDLSYVFAGMVIVYAVSGIAMNHRDSFNPQYSVTLREIRLEGDFPCQVPLQEKDVLECISQVGETSYTQFYHPDSQQMKVFLKGGSSLVVNTQTGVAVYEQIERRYVLGFMARLHYNPGRMWTWFADLFGISLIIITITGLVMVKGKYGLWGRGGLELAAGLLVPTLILIFM